MFPALHKEGYQFVRYLDDSFLISHFLMIDNNAFISFLKFVSESGLQAH